MLKIEENEQEGFNSPSYLDKNSTHDNKIFEGSSFRQGTPTRGKFILCYFLKKLKKNSGEDISRKTSMKMNVEIKMFSPKNC